MKPELNLPPPKQPHFASIAGALTAKGRTLPRVLAFALANDFRPLALDTRASWPQWAKAAGYDDEDVQLLMTAVRRLVNAPPYLEAVVEDGSWRHDAEGEPVEPVSAMDRHSTALRLFSRSLKRAGFPAKALQAEPAEPRPPEPLSPGAGGSRLEKRPINPPGLRPLSAAEIERRKAALERSGLRPQAAPFPPRPSAS